MFVITRAKAGVRLSDLATAGALHPEPGLNALEFSELLADQSVIAGRNSCDMDEVWLRIGPPLRVRSRRFRGDGSLDTLTVDDPGRLGARPASRRPLLDAGLARPASRSEVTGDLAISGPRRNTGDAG